MYEKRRLLSDLFPNPHLMERPDRADPAIDFVGFRRAATLDEAVGVVEDPPGADREAALDEQVPMDLGQLPLKVGMADAVRPVQPGQAEQGDTGRAESKGNSRGFVHAGFSGVVEACSWSTRWMVVRETR
jgi:hypothetical protein